MAEVNLRVMSFAMYSLYSLRSIKDQINTLPYLTILPLIFVPSRLFFDGTKFRILQCTLWLLLAYPRTPPRPSASVNSPLEDFWGLSLQTPLYIVFFLSSQVNFWRRRSTNRRNTYQGTSQKSFSQVIVHNFKGFKFAPKI